MMFLKKGKLPIVVLFFILCPWPFVDRIVEPSMTPRVFCLAFILLFCLNAWNKKQNLIGPPLFVLIPLCLFYLFAFSGIVNALNTADLIFSVQKTGLFIATFCLMYPVLAGESERLLWARTLLLVLFSFTIYFFFLVAKLPAYGRNNLYEVRLFLEHKNLLASLLFILLAFPVWIVIQEKGNWRILSFVTMFLTIGLLLVLQVRSVYLALTVTSVLFFILTFRRSTVWIKLCLIAMLAFLVLAFYGSAIVHETSIASNTESTIDSGNERLLLWKKTLKMIADHPLSGVGSGNWQYNYALYGVQDLENATVNSVNFQHPHNEVLSVFSENGIVGVLLLSVVLIFVLRHSWFSAVRRRNYSVLIFLVFGAGILVESCFSFPKERIMHLALLAVFLAFMLQEQGLYYFYPEKLNKGLTYFFALVLLLCLSSSFFRMRGEFYTLKYLSYQRSGQPQQALTEIKKAISPYYSCDPTSSPIVGYAAQACYELNKRDSLFLYSERAYKLSPYDVESLSNYGMVLDMQNKRNEGRKILNEALRINPFYIRARLNLIALEYNSGNYQTAFNELQKIPDYETAYPLYFQRIRDKIK